MSRQLRDIALLVFVQVLIVASANVSPKLDFGDGDVVKVKKEIAVGKIKGLRVTVDTSELKESKSSGSESSSSSESSEKRKTIGVRTDVTFEITSAESNDTKIFDEKEIGKVDDNASIPIVPVFKGTNRDNPTPGHTAFHHSNNPYDDRNRYGVADQNGNAYPQFAIWTTERYNRKHNQHQPVYHHRGGGYDINQKPPPNFVPYQINHDRHPPWQPCNCKEYPGPYINPHPQPQPQPPAELTQKVDDKLERPFSKTS